MAAAGAGQAGQDRRRSATTRISDERRVLAIKHHALHLALADVVIDGDRAVGAEHFQFSSLG